MISWRNFVEATEKALGKYRTSDADQMGAIKKIASENVAIYAGPGTGKTATLTLRIIKLVLVNARYISRLFQKKK